MRPPIRPPPPPPPRSEEGRVPQPVANRNHLQKTLFSQLVVAVAVVAVAGMLIRQHIRIRITTQIYVSAHLLSVWFYVRSNRRAEDGIVIGMGYERALYRLECPSLTHPSSFILLLTLPLVIDSSDEVIDTNLDSLSLLSPFPSLYLTTGSAPPPPCKLRLSPYLVLSLPRTRTHHALLRKLRSTTPRLLT